ncbi:MAG: LAS superfamily LD-carboxypeptidase LdcB [Halieaceae bacterium]
MSWGVPGAVSPQFSERFLCGMDSRALVTVDGQQLLPEVSQAFAHLASAGAEEGFELVMASAYRSFERQLHIWNGKLRGERPVLDQRDQPLSLSGMSPAAQVAAVLRFSALPGASRHHWGTDIDVFDAAAVSPDYRVQLCAAEVCEGGVFDPLHCWLDRCIARGESFGFYRPYDRDRGGVAPERWHLSYAPLAQHCAARVTGSSLRRCWSGEPAAADFALREHVDARLEELLERFCGRVSDIPGYLLPGNP